MKTSYSVLWQQADGDVVSGRLQLLPLGFRFTPAKGGAAGEEVHYEDLAAIRIGTQPVDELDGKPAVVIERRAGPSVRIASVAKRSLASELARGLESLALGGEMAPARLLVIVPLKKGAASAAERLLRSGPPFAPAQAGLERHEAYLTANEAVFVFESLEGEATLKALLASAPVWEAAPAWRELIAGPPRVAEAAYAWEQGRLGDEAEAAAAEL
jgi:hypothetical protein